MLRYVKNKIQTVSKKCVIFWHDILVKLIAIYVTSGIFAGRAQRDPAKSHELHKIAFPKVLHTRFFLILTKKSFFKR
jgi:hypothetical protein